MMYSLRAPWLLLLAILCPHFLQSQEWPRFRGENGSGIGKISSLPDQITKADYEWAVRLDGIGHSSPVLWGNRLFLTLFDSEEGVRRVLCFDSSRGSILWQQEYPVLQHNLHKHNNFASSTPVASSEAVFMVWGDGNKTEAIAIDHEGKKLWQRDWPSFSSDHGFGASPILVDNVLVLHTDSVAEKRSQIVGLDPKTGETLWEVERITSNPDEKHLTAYNTPTTLTLKEQTVLVVLQTNDGWKGLAPQTGEVLWEYDGDYNLRSVGSIAGAQGILFATFGSGGSGKMATALRPKESGTPEVLYELGISDGLSYVPTPLFHQDRLYLWADGGILTCRNAKTGEQIYRERVGGNFFSSPVVADGKIYCGSRDGELVAVRLGDQFEILGRSRLSSGMNATPAIANNRMYLRTDSHLLCIRGR